MPASHLLARLSRGGAFPSGLIRTTQRTLGKGAGLSGCAALVIHCLFLGHHQFSSLQSKDRENYIHGLPQPAASLLASVTCPDSSGVPWGQREDWEGWWRAEKGWMSGVDGRGLGRMGRGGGIGHIPMGLNGFCLNQGPVPTRD